MKYSKKLVNCVLIQLCVIFFIPIPAYGEPTLKKKIDALIQEKIPNATVGVLVEDAKTGKILYQYNANKTLSPASGLKVFTSAAALQTLGPEYQFYTRVQTEPNSLQASEQGQDRGNVLTKNLYIQFSGDPSLTSSDLKDLVKTALQTHQIKKILGKVILDTTHYQAPNYPFGWGGDDLAWYFAAPVTSVILDENVAKLKINANKMLGGKADINVWELQNNISVESTVISVTEEAAATECSIQVAMDQKNHAVLNGCWPQHSEPDTIKLAVQNPALLAQTIIQETLNELKVEWANEIELGKMPKGVEVLQQHASEPLKRLLKPILEESNNLYAESLFKEIGLQKKGQGTFLAGVQAMKEILTEDFGLKAGEFRIEDGSGASRYDLITPTQMAQVLQKIYQSKLLFPIFWEFLPQWGETGTLKSRSTDSSLTGKFRAKTGYMTGVTTLSGYLTPCVDQTLIVVIMMNNTLEKTEKLREFQEALLLQFIHKKP